MIKKIINSFIPLLLFMLMPGQNIYSQTFGDGFYRLTTAWQGEGKSLDVVNDGVNDKIQLAKTSSASGQFWKITPVGRGFYRLTTKWLGEDRSLDVVNDGANNRLQLAKTGDFSGQFWKIESVSKTAESADPKPETTRQEMFLSGFKIIVGAELAKKDETKEALEILSDRLQVITETLPPKHLALVKKVPIWIQYKLRPDGAVWYHSSKAWLTSNGYPAEMEKSVEIKNIRNFIDWQSDQPFMVLHELAHAYQDLYLTKMQNKIDLAYQNAVRSGKYESVPYIRGGKQRHYALNNNTEYFAELTEAYFGKNDYYPFNRKDLAEFDPEGYKMIREAWDEKD